jgi:hypothetical protein
MSALVTRQSSFSAISATLSAVKVLPVPGPPWKRMIRALPLPSMTSVPRSASTFPCLQLLQKVVILGIADTWNPNAKLRGTELRLIICVLQGDHFCIFSLVEPTFVCIIPSLNSLILSDTVLRRPRCRIFHREACPLDPCCQPGRGRFRRQEVSRWHRWP